MNAANMMRDTALLRSKNQTNAAIETMERAVAEARRRVEGARDPGEAARRVMHEFAWGLANATSNLEAALNAHADACAIDGLKLAEMLADSMLKGQQAEGVDPKCAPNLTTKNE